MYFDIADSEIEGFEGDMGYEYIPDNTDTGVDKYGKKYAIRKKKIYANTDRIEAISKFVVERLISVVYPQIRRKAKAMLAVSSIPSAIKYKGFIDKYFKELTQEKKYEEYKDTPVFIVYSDSQEYQRCSKLNNGLNEEKVLRNFKLCKNGLIIVVDKLQTGFDEPKLQTLFLDKEIRGINAIQTISRVNRTMKYKNDCKIIDFSYKNKNVENIKEAFAHFSNVVVSDFDPLGDEDKLIEHYKDLKKHSLFKRLFGDFKKYHQSYDKDINIILNLENSFEDYILSQKKEAKEIKKIINSYFKILNLIEFVIDLDDKYNEKLFLDFWRNYNKEYARLNRQDEIIDDVEIYFDNKIGILAPKDYEERVKTKPFIVADPQGEYKKYKYDILKVIEKRNQEEEEILELIEEFEQKITAFFAYIQSDNNGKRLIAKIKDDGSVFTPDEIYNDFSKIYRKYTIKNKDLGKFFMKETRDILSQLCDDFEREVKYNTK